MGGFSKLQLCFSEISALFSLSCSLLCYQNIYPQRLVSKQLNFLFLVYKYISTSISTLLQKSGNATSFNVFFENKIV